MYVGPFSFLSDLEHFREDKLEEQNKHKVKVAEFTQFAEWYKGFFGHIGWKQMVSVPLKSASGC